MGKRRKDEVKKTDIETDENRKPPEVVKICDLYLRFQNYNFREIKRVQDHLNQQFEASFWYVNGYPVMENDGTYRLRVNNIALLSIIKGILTDHYRNIKLVKEVKKDILKFD